MYTILVQSKQKGILESAIKITNEPPTGMRANIHKALDNFSQDTLESSLHPVLLSRCCGRA